MIQNDPARFGKVAVLMGGRSAEREVSLASGTAVLAALLRRGVDAYAEDVDDTLLTRLRTQNYARVFIILHGRGGEDGVIQGALETLEIPYTGSGVLGSAVGMNKLYCKQLWQSQGLPTPEYANITKEQELTQAMETLGPPLMVKPAHEGSSIGITRLDRPDQISDAWRKASIFDQAVFAERCIEGAEYTAAYLDGEVLPLIRLETPNQFYDYKAKYQSNSTRYLCPCGLDTEQELTMQNLALRAFQAVGGDAWGRIDLFLDRANNPWLIEVNTVPGMTDHSLVPIAAKASGMDFDSLVVRILETSL